MLAYMLRMLFLQAAKPLVQHVRKQAFDRPRTTADAAEGPPARPSAPQVYPGCGMALLLRDFVGIVVDLPRG